MGADPEEAELSLRAALGDARLGAGDAGAALAEWERYLRHGGSREAEKAFARAGPTRWPRAWVTRRPCRCTGAATASSARAALGPGPRPALRAAG